MAQASRVVGIAPVYREILSIISVQTVCCPNPDKALFVLRDCINVEVGQALFGGDSVDHHVDARHAGSLSTKFLRESKKKDQMEESGNGRRGRQEGKNEPVEHRNEQRPAAAHLQASANRMVLAGSDSVILERRNKQYVL